MSLLDPARIADVLPGMFGGAVTGLYHFSAVVMGGGSPVTADYLRLAMNMVLAVLIGGIFAYFLTDALVSIIPWAAFKDASAVSFGIGLLSWELFPLFIMAASNRARKEADKQGDGP